MNFLRVDKTLLLVILGLLAFGVVVIYSSSGPYALMKYQNETLIVSAHVKKVIIGVVFLLAAISIPVEYWRRAIRPLFLLSLFFMLLLFSPLGVETNGARRWLDIGIKFQPSELMKFALILHLAVKLEENQDKIQDFKEGFLPPLFITAFLAGLLLLQPNYSMLMSVSAICVSLLYLAGARAKHIGVLFLSGVPILLGMMALAPYRMKRILSFLDSAEFSSSGAYQQIQSVYSLGNGGFFGTGLGKGTQKLGYIPEPYTDMIFATLGEELGFVGTSLVLVAFGILIWRGMVIAKRAGNLFESLAAAGVTLAVAINVFIHVGVCMKIGPVTGQPLPLISYGGTSLWMSLLGLGFLLAVSAHQNKSNESQSGRIA